VARETRFVQRESTLTAEKFISLCAFYKDSICKTSLSNLCSIIAAEENIIISPQALNEKKHISEFKSFAIVKEHSCNIRNCIFGRTKELKLVL